MSSESTAASCLGSTVRSDFPFFEQQPGLVYLNSSAMPLRPRTVLESVSRGFFDPTASASALAEAERRIARFLSVDEEDVQPVMGCHMAFERVYELIHSPERNVYLTSPFAHKAALTPLDRWQRRGWVRRLPLQLDASGRTDVSALAERLGPEVRAVVVNHVASVTGAVEPLEDIAALLKDHGERCGRDVLLIVDGAQSVPRLPVDAGVADFYLVASQKCGALPGGVVITSARGRAAIAGSPDPGRGLLATREHLRAGTPHIESVVSLASAFEYLGRLRSGTDTGMVAVERAIAKLTERLLDGLAKVGGIEVLGESRRFNAGIVSFLHRDRSAGELGAALAERGIVVRAGVKDAFDHWFCVPDLPEVHPAVRQRDGAIRASLSFYNTPGDIDRLLAALEEVIS
ncbi:MAG: aminotransferase class V-fold PLP-dependent enzyme [Planctomycetota bacterium]